MPRPVQLLKPERTGRVKSISRSQQGASEWDSIRCSSLEQINCQQLSCPGSAIFIYLFFCASNPLRQTSVATGQRKANKSKKTHTTPYRQIAVPGSPRR
ncbi:hypothetical protein BJY01DRAFT_228698 [Aspergillus pseudoustus]|uniref:Uncharacterized protein n=1 Tax=Aspergillus pseudoustus TaxID=1810923 RepID=A0ABR4IK55_9EURO